VSWQLPHSGDSLLDRGTARAFKPVVIEALKMLMWPDAGQAHPVCRIRHILVAWPVDTFGELAAFDSDPSLRSSDLKDGTALRKLSGACTLGAFQNENASVQRI
jgi:hypothetical protein